MPRRKLKLPQATVEAKIVDLSFNGKGVAKIAGKPVFITGALPGEKIKFKYTRRRHSYDEGIVCEVLKPSIERVEPQCEFFNFCGGCSLQHLNYSAQINFKQKLIIEQFKLLANIDNFQILPALVDQSFGYRRKARLGARMVVKKNKVLVGFREKNTNFICAMSSCQTLHPKVGYKISALQELITNMEANDKIAQIELAVADNATALVFRNLTTLSAFDINKLDEFGKKNEFAIYLQPGGPKTVTPLNKNHSRNTFYMAAGIKYEFSASDFTQINFAINQKMIAKTLELLELKPKDKVLDLFCGIGNFSLAIATRAELVLGIELSAMMIKKARHNAKINNIANAKFQASDLQNAEEPVAIKDGSWNKILLDPPRNGAIEIMPLIGKIYPERIVYISCNPATLARDANVLVNEFGYKCQATGLIDMFPQTSHVESITLFVKG